MLSRAFGFDLLGQRHERLWVGVWWGFATAAAESIGYGVLYYLLTIVYAEQVDHRTVLGALAVFTLLALLMTWLRAKVYDESFSTSFANVAAARLRLADHISQLPSGNFTHKRTEAVADLLTSRFQLYQDVVVHIWGMAVANAALPVFLWLLLIVIDWRLALVALLLVPLAFATIPWSHRMLAKASLKLSKIRNEALSSVVEHVEGARELTQFDLERCRLDLADKRLADLEREQMRLELAPAPALLTFAFVLQLGLGATAVAGAYALHDDTITAVTLLGGLVVAQRYFRAIGDLAINLTELRFARGILDEIRQLANEPAMPMPQTGDIPKNHSITFDRVSFSYGSDVILREISGHIDAGSVVALVGMSGAGKSTLAGLLARLQDVTGGAIRIGGADIRNMTAETLNRQIAMVLQDVVLFDGTIADNIRLARPEASIEDVITAAREAEIGDFIENLPEGYETRVIADGTNFSGGERQRMAIARALLKDAPILILDEATSSVDLTNEEALQKALSRLTKQRTVLVIAHRLWTIASADEIWVMSGGQIVQRGTHQDLVLQDGQYRMMWQAQAQARSWRVGT